ncbi:MAG: T9SS type A sorting domain-containing protein [Flavobacteriales bacterium]|nr:T9SS type A sorting domain-containing protein [Flavobacteriales bacterium]
MRKGHLLVALVVFSSVQSFGQMFSPSASALPDGELGETYVGQVIDFTVPTNATISGEVVVQALAFVYPQTQPVLGFLNIDNQEFPMIVDRASLLPQGLPSGLTATCDATPCTYIDGASGYLTIAGTPTEAGQFTFNIKTLTEGDVDISSITGGILSSFGLPTSLALPTPVPSSLDEDGYTINILNTSSIEEYNQTFGLGIYPNPVSDEACLNVTSMQPGKMFFEVFDNAGRKVHGLTSAIGNGTNRIDLGFSHLKPGIYSIKATMGEDMALIRTIKL